MIELSGSRLIYRSLLKRTIINPMKKVIADREKAAEKPYSFSIIVMSRGEKDPILIYKKNVVNILVTILAFNEM